MLVVLAAVLLLSAEVSSRVCNSQTKLLTGTRGSLSSPDQRQSGTCTWSIVVPGDLRIIFYFKAYNIDNCPSSSACRDCTRIELKNDQSEPAWETFCGSKSEIPEPISTNTSTLHINFVLPNDDSDSWFTAEYATWPFQGKIDLTATSTGEISSPMFPGKYPRNSYFLWSVVAPSEYRVKIEFSKFDLYRCEDCKCDYLIIRDGPSSQSELIGKYCSGPGIVYTPGNHVWMEFVSAMDRQHRSDRIGFKATVSKGHSSSEIKLYVIVIPCVFGIIFLTLVVAVIVLMRRRRRLSSPGNGNPVVQMSLLNEDTQLSDSGPHSEANAPVYRPTTRAIKS